MKRLQKWPYLLLFVLVGLCCRKDDFPFVACDITQITTVLPAGSAPVNRIVNDFTYNAWGEPLKIITSSPGTGNPNYEFKYDSKSRLIELVAWFSAQNQFTTTRYYYGSNGLIAFDTSYLTGAPQINAVTKYLYDSKFRISRTDQYRNGVLAFTKEYKYDARGNLIVPNAIYDNKINIHRTNLVWMFVDRDYSMNNRLPADFQHAETYNKKGLLTSFNSNAPAGYINAPSILGHQANEVMYDCNENRKGKD